MEIKGRRGTKNRDVEIYLHQTDEDMKLRLSVIAPSFLNYMKYLQIKTGDSNTKKWLRTSRGVRQLSNSNNSDKVFDSDFLVSDFSGFDYENSRLEYHGEESLEGILCDVVTIENNSDDTDFSKKVCYVRKESGLIQKIEYFDGDDKVKEYLLIEDQVIRGSEYPRECSMTNLKDKTSTLILFKKVEEVQSIPSRIFNKGSL